MSNLLEDHPPVPSSPRRFQFTLRTLFIVSFLFAIFCAGIFSSFDGIRALTLLLTLMTYPIVLVALAIYSKGYLRSFGIGASISFLPFFVLGGVVVFYYILIVLTNGSPAIDLDFTKSSTVEDGLKYWWPSLCVFLLLLYSAVPGGTMVITCWLIDRSRRQEQTETPQVAAPECTKS